MTEEMKNDNDDVKNDDVKKSKSTSTKKKKTAKAKVTKESISSTDDNVIDVDAKTIETEAESETPKAEDFNKDSTADKSNSTGEQKDWKEFVPERDWGQHFYSLAMLVAFGFLGTFASYIFIFLLAINWVYELGFENKNETISNWTNVLGLYIKQIVDMFTGKTDELPFPLGKNFPLNESKSDS